MPDPVIEVQLEPFADKLRLEWGLTVQDQRWVWDQPKLEVRLYCRPYPDFGKPLLLNTDLDDLHTTHTSGGAFRIPFIDVTVGKEKSRSGFRPGIVAADPTGKYYPLELDLSDVKIPAGGIVCYPAVEWPVNGAWLEKPFDCWVVFGYTARGEFIPVHQAPPFEHRPEGKKPEESLPDDVPAVAADDRVRRRGATKRLFISYSHADVFTVNAIVKRLNDEFYYDIWIDYDNIPGGSQWRTEIARGITGADRVLFLLSPTAVNSAWCQEEVRYALDKGIPVIPIRINGTCGDADLAKVGLGGVQYRDFAKDRPDWDGLLADLPVVMPRNKRWRDEGFRQRHTDYLRSLFHRYSRVNLTYLLDAMPKDEVSLLDVYVPLKLDVSFNIEVVNGEYADWWLRKQDEKREEVPEGMAHQEPHHPKTLNGFAPQDSAMRAWETELREGWERFKARHDEQQAGKKEAERQPLEDGTYRWIRIESETAPALHPHLVITGDPGSGKSTLTRHLALCMAGDQLFEATNEVERRADLDLLGFWPHPAYTPVYIELRDLVQKTFPDARDGVTLQKLYDYLCQEQLTPAGCANYLGDLRDQMRDGDVMFFLDGLDEVPDAETKDRREQIKTLARLLQDSFPHCRIVITARPYAYAGDWHIDGFGQVSLAPLDEDRLEELALRLFRQVLGQEGAEEQAPQFKKHMSQVREELRRSPLFFTLLAAIWLNNQTAPPDQRLPVSPGAIYRACVEMLLRRWTVKDLHTGASVSDVIGLDKAQLREMLERLAYRVHRQISGDADSGFECGLIMTVVRTEMRVRGVDYDALLDTLAQRAGVIYERAPDEFTFAHRSFQEHLAACHWTRDFPVVAAQDLADAPGLWRNVFELFPAEAERQHLDLWSLVERLLPQDVSALPADPEDLAWWQVYFAARLMSDSIPAGDRQQRLFRPQLRDGLAKLVTLGALPTTERAGCGRTLAELGDPRPGVLAPGGIPEFAWCEIPAGPFRMGGDPDAYTAWDGAEFDLPTSFWIAKYPVTYAQYEAFVSAKGYENDAYWTPDGLEWRGEKRQPEACWNDPKWHIANHPVVGVTWYEAYAYSQWLNDQPGVRPANAPAGYAIRLARECEWEKAARHPDGRFFPWGNEWDATRLNSSEGGIRRTSAVGIFPNGANPAHGANDLCGNVWEWCLTGWADQYESPDAENNAPHGDALRVLRGGSWNSLQDNARAAYRGRSHPNNRYDHRGFRVVCASPI